MTNEEYWNQRRADSISKKSRMNEKDVRKAMRIYYKKAMNTIIKEYEATYDKLLAQSKEKEKPLLSDLYKLDKYYQMQAQIIYELRKLGDKESKVLNKTLYKEFWEIYNSIILPEIKTFKTIDSEGVKALISEVWCSDGKNYSQRIWEDTESLLASLNENLASCIISGKTTKELKQRLMQNFGVSYHRAETLTRTEMSHVQNTAARQRYIDYGVEEFEVWADKDERRCEICGKLHKKRFNVMESSPVPVHPNCRCTIIPVIKTK